MHLLDCVQKDTNIAPLFRNSRCNKRIFGENPDLLLAFLNALIPLETIRLFRF